MVRQGLRGPLAVYRDCLSDPFEFPPIRLGYDTFLPTSLHTAYLRIPVGINSDGSFDLIANPSLKTMLASNSAVAGASPVWTGADCANLAALSSQINSFRIVGYAMRVYPQIALTAAPGLVVKGIQPTMDADDYDAFTALSNSARTSLPQSQFSLTRTAETEFHQVSWRPTDNADFEFKDRKDFCCSISSGTFNPPVAYVNLNKGITDTGGAILRISGTGLPIAGASLFVELIMHIECIDAINNITTDTSNDSTPQVSNDTSVGSVESAYRSIIDSLPDPTSLVKPVAGFVFGAAVNAASARYSKYMTPGRSGPPIGWVSVD